MLPQSIPRVQTTDRNINQLQQNLIPVVQQIINNPIVSGAILSGVALVAGTNVVSHGLARTLQGWSTTRVRANATIYDNQDNNTTPQLTLILIASAAVTVDLLVF